MKVERTKELRQKADNELTRDLSAFQEKIRELHFKMRSQEVKNVKEIAAIKKNVAKILTILAERRVSEESK